MKASKKPTIGKTIDKTRATILNLSPLVMAIMARIKAARPNIGGNRRTETEAKTIARIDKVFLLLSWRTTVGPELTGVPQLGQMAAVSTTPLPQAEQNLVVSMEFSFLSGNTLNKTIA